MKEVYKMEKQLIIKEGMILAENGAFVGMASEGIIAECIREGYTVYDIQTGMTHQAKVKEIEKDGIVMDENGKFIRMADNKGEKNEKVINRVSEIGIKGCSDDICSASGNENDDDSSTRDAKPNMLGAIYDDSMEFVQDNEDVITSVFISVVLFVAYTLFTNEDNKVKAKEQKEKIVTYVNNFRKPKEVEVQEDQEESEEM